MTVHALAVPTPFRVGAVNCYLVEDDPLTLVDTGPNSAKALDALERGLAEHGRRVEDLERIVVTHQHVDHTGLLDVLARRSGAEVAGIDVLAPYLADHGAAMERDDELAVALMLRHGIERRMVTALRDVSRAMRGWASGATITRPLADGDVLEFASRRWRVHHRPGHSPSDTVFHDEAAGIVVGGDHLLARISSNPLISRALGGRSGSPADGRPRALPTYLRSLAETRAMEDVRVVLPGHGEPFSGHAELVDARFAMHERRARRIAGLLEDGPRSAHEIAQELWGNVAVTEAYLTLSEVLGHLDLLEDRGEVAEVEAGGVARFELRRRRS